MSIIICISCILKANWMNLDGPVYNIFRLFVVSEAMVSAENAWLTPSPASGLRTPSQRQLPSPTNAQLSLLVTLPHRETILHTPLIQSIPQHHLQSPLTSPSSTDLILIDRSQNRPDLVLDISAERLQVAAALAVANTQTLSTNCQQTIARSDSTTTESTEAEDELTSKTLSAITAAITTIKEIKRESQLIDSHVVALEDSTASDQNLITGTTTFYLPTPRGTTRPFSTKSAIPATPSTLRDFTSFPPLPSVIASPPLSTSNTTFYLPPPTTVITETPVTQLKTVSLIRQSPTITEICKTSNLNTQNQESASTQYTEIPVIFINTKNPSRKDTHESVIPSIVSDPLVSSLLFQNFYPKIQQPKKTNFQTQESELIKKQSSLSTFHVPLTWETNCTTLTSTLIETEAVAPVVTKEETSTLSSSRISDLITPQSPKLITSPIHSLASTTTSILSTSVPVAVAPVHHLQSSTTTALGKPPFQPSTPPSSTVFYDIPVLVTTSIRVR